MNRGLAQVECSSGRKTVRTISAGAEGLAPEEALQLAVDFVTGGMSILQNLEIEPAEITRILWAAQLVTTGKVACRGAADHSNGPAVH